MRAVEPPQRVAEKGMVLGHAAGKLTPSIVGGDHRQQHRLLDSEVRELVPGQELHEPIRRGRRRFIRGTCERSGNHQRLMVVA
jgi:hypothetical protein